MNSTVVPQSLSVPNDVETRFSKADDKKTSRSNDKEIIAFVDTQNRGYIVPQSLSVPDDEKTRSVYNTSKTFSKAEDDRIFKANNEEVIAFVDTQNRENIAVKIDVYPAQDKLNKDIQNEDFVEVLTDKVNEFDGTKSRSSTDTARRITITEDETNLIFKQSPYFDPQNAKCRENGCGKCSLSLFPRRPSVSKHQAVVMAAQLFNLNIADPSSVKELDSYDDRNFFMRGSLMGGKKEMECPVAKIPSIFKTTFVKCKIPRAAQPGGVSIVTESVALGTDNVALKNRQCCLRNRLCCLGTDSGSVVISNNRSFDTLGSVNNAGNLEDGIEIYDGKEYYEEECFVCAVRLLTFVPGKMLNEIPLNTELLFNAGMAVGRLDRDLKDFECPRIDRPGFLWDLSGIGDNVEQFLEAVNDKRHKKNGSRRL
ncbi:hypothetical protein OS493_021207 [Desmophyllum pertusum]|uniref:Uncharacterized protein n=1 Tax=Desmophyllum pertusum TaxID=174260 RepID=A0A9W9ZN37_9CNID|nr:hypothetical protein OS493_021207 [Desmophyllum pertusum]